MGDETLDARLTAIQAQIDAHSKLQAGLAAYVAVNEGAVREAAQKASDWYMERIKFLRAAQSAERRVLEHGLPEDLGAVTAEIYADLQRDREAFEAAFSVFRPPGGPGDAATASVTLNRL